MFFSVIIPTYNRPKHILLALQSVLNQTFKDFEIIVVNDGSTIDYSEIEKFCSNNPNIKYVYQTNKYLAGARNTGMKNSSGKFICFLDDDDIYLSNHLEALHQTIILNNTIDAIYHTRTLIQYFNGEKVKVNETKTNYINNLDKLLSDRFPTNAACISTKIAKEYNFNEQLKYSEDLEMWINVSQKYPIIKSPEYTTLLREEELTKMSDFKLPNQEHYYNSFLHIKNKYSGYVPFEYINIKLFELAVRCAELYKQSKNFKKSISYLFKAASYNYNFILSRHFWSILVKR